MTNSTVSAVRYSASGENMNSRFKGEIIFTSAILLLLTPSVASAETPRILPYLLENHQNPSVRVRCLSSQKREVIRDHLLQPPQSDVWPQEAEILHTADTVTIDIAGSCRRVKIRVQDEASFDDYWLTRKGSGWYWLLRH